MALTRIEYGALASSEVMNDNFEYLENQIAEISERITTNTAGIYSNIASINSSISTLQDNISDELADIRSSISSLAESNGLYITTSINGTSWYREFFSDEEKTQRVWLEQGFVTPNTSWTANSTKTYNLLKSFSNTSYTVLAIPTLAVVKSGSYSVPLSVTALTNSTISIVNAAASTLSARVYACGK